jgi:hypothetical protein
MNTKVHAWVVCLTVIAVTLPSLNAQERSPSWQLTTLYTFLGEADGASPSEVGLDPAGNLYGITAYGGDAGCGQSGGCGVAFGLNARGHESILHSSRVSGRGFGREGMGQASYLASISGSNPTSITPSLRK